MVALTLVFFLLYYYPLLSLTLVFFTLLLPSPFLFIRRDMSRSSKLDFYHLFLLYYIFYGYKHIIIRKYI
jgi:hypothetical protein